MKSKNEIFRYFIVKKSLAENKENCFKKKLNKITHENVSCYSHLRNEKYSLFIYY